MWNLENSAAILEANQVYKEDNKLKRDKKSFEDWKIWIWKKIMLVLLIIDIVQMFSEEMLINNLILCIR